MLDTPSRRVEDVRLRSFSVTYALTGLNNGRDLR